MLGRGGRETVPFRRIGRGSIEPAMNPTRRAFLGCSAGCLGSLSLHRALNWAAQANDAQLSAPRATHHAAKAHNLVFVFLTGGFSLVDTFDYKPRLKADEGRVVRAVHLRGA